MARKNAIGIGIIDFFTQIVYELRYAYKLRRSLCVEYCPVEMKSDLECHVYQVSAALNMIRQLQIHLHDCKFIINIG